MPGLADSLRKRCNIESAAIPQIQASPHEPIWIRLQHLMAEASDRFKRQVLMGNDENHFHPVSIKKGQCIDTIG